MPQEDFFVQKNYSNNNKNVAVELLPKYKTHGGTGRWNDQSRKKHHLEQAKKLKVTRKFVMELFKKENTFQYNKHSKTHENNRNPQG